MAFYPPSRAACGPTSPALGSAAGAAGGLLAAHGRGAGVGGGASRGRGSERVRSETVVVVIDGEVIELVDSDDEREEVQVKGGGGGGGGRRGGGEAGGGRKEEEEDEESERAVEFVCSMMGYSDSSWRSAVRDIMDNLDGDIEKTLDFLMTFERARMTDGDPGACGEAGAGEEEGQLEWWSGVDGGDAAVVNDAARAADANDGIGRSVGCGGGEAAAAAGAAAIVLGGTGRGGGSGSGGGARVKSEGRADAHAGWCGDGGAAAAVGGEGEVDGRQQQEVSTLAEMFPCILRQRIAQVLLEAGGDMDAAVSRLVAEAAPGPEEDDLLMLEREGGQAGQTGPRKVGDPSASLEGTPQKGKNKKKQRAGQGGSLSNGRKNSHVRFAEESAEVESCDKDEEDGKGLLKHQHQQQQQQHVEEEEAERLEWWHAVGDVGDQARQQQQRQQQQPQAEQQQHELLQPRVKSEDEAAHRDNDPDSAAIQLLTDTRAGADELAAKAAHLQGIFPDVHLPVLAALLRDCGGCLETAVMFLEDEGNGGATEVSTQQQHNINASTASAAAAAAAAPQVPVATLNPANDPNYVPLDAATAAALAASHPHFFPHAAAAGAVAVGRVRPAGGFRTGSDGGTGFRHPQHHHNHHHHGAAVLGSSSAAAHASSNQTGHAPWGHNPWQSNLAGPAAGLFGHDGAFPHLPHVTSNDILLQQQQLAMYQQRKLLQQQQQQQQQQLQDWQQVGGEPRLQDGQRAEAVEAAGYSSSRATGGDSGGDGGDLYRRHRKEAREMHRMSKYYAAEAVAAYRRGEKNRAADLSGMAKACMTKMKELDMAAGQKIFSETQQRHHNNVVIDLHSLHVDEALSQVKMHLTLLRSLPTIHSVSMVTGRGNHSAGGVAKIKPAVLKLLRAEGVRKWTEESGGGCIRVLKQDV